MTYTITQLANLSGLTVRTLHYYDEIGLLKPSFVAPNGYRHYDNQALLRLQQILFYRELNFKLEDIRTIITNPRFDLLKALEEHKKIITLQQARLQKLFITINKTMSDLQKHKNTQPHDLYDAFSDPDQKVYQAEALQRWGDTAAYKQSVFKVAKISKIQMEEIKKEWGIINEQLSQVMGKNVTDEAVQAVVERHYRQVSRFYDVTVEMYRKLGQMYVDDPRFAATYNKVKPGMATFLRDAIVHYCELHK